MNMHIILVVGFVLSVTGCAEKEQVNSDPVEEAPVTAPEAVASTAGNESWRNDSFLKHMHRHAAKLDELNYALADDDLEAAMKPAYWLSRHDTASDVQPEWLPYLYRMRAEAKAVEVAPDLATARAAAKRINDQCQGCHAAAGINAQ
jgi:hypothetical protein